ncbi:cytokine receptor common subunit beta [Misgurnus anguillicaudatus]|uniref:cytokine receptor common subunit beta n=1 Tax=Misgurnus anguillicaudatus TaxID=75329 RepID=UPI003CCFB495
MFFIWTLHMNVFALLVRTTTADQCPLHDAKPGTVSPVMDSLQCYNDYETHVQCTWEEDPLIHSQAAENSSLLSWDSYEEALCVSLGPGVVSSNGKISHSCRYNTTMFTLEIDHKVYFNVSCKSRGLSLIVAKHGKVLAPVDLTEKMANGSGHVVSWRSPYPASSNITATLTYQLQYRISGQDWTVVYNGNESKYMIEKQLLLPGYLYQARVRARGPLGMWSNWSPLVSWRSQDDEVFNLQCEIKGEKDVTCSWQMKTVNSHFISYHLWYSHNDSSQVPRPSRRCPNPLVKPRDAGITEFICSINTNDPYGLTVELRPVYNSKTFRTSENVHPPQPAPVQVKERDGVFRLSWSINWTDLIKYFVQLKISNSETSMLYNLTGNEGFEIPSSSLDPSTHYEAQIRLVLSSKDSPYSGRPSEWSRPKRFTTGPASWSVTTIIYILISLFVAVIFIVLYNALPVFHRKIELWKGSIPSPIHSKVMEGIIKSSSGWPYLQSEKEKTSMCVIQATDNISICKSSVSGDPLLFYSEDVISNATLKKGWPDETSHAHSYVGESMYPDHSGISFSGPYILCCEDSCDQEEIIDVYSDESHGCMCGTPNNSGAINGGYVVTPPTTMSVTRDPTHVDSSTNNPTDEPPAYTPRLDQGGIVHPHPSGYFMMPCVGMIQSEPKGYVALSQPGT